MYKEGEIIIIQFEFLFSQIKVSQKLHIGIITIMVFVGFVFVSFRKEVEVPLATEDDVVDNDIDHILCEGCNNGS